MNNHNDNMYRALNRHSSLQAQKRKRRNKQVMLSFYIIFILALSCAVYLLAKNVINPMGTNVDPHETLPSVVTTIPEGSQTEPPVTTTAPAYQYKEVVMGKDDYRKGNLILVSADFEYLFKEDLSSIITIYGNKSKNFKVASTAIQVEKITLDALNAMFDKQKEETNEHSVIVNSGYRSLVDQESLYATRVASVGAVEAAKYVAIPGGSEHHTGLAVDFAVYTDDKISMTLDKAEGYDWVYKNADRFGFILRYPESKIGLTGIGYEPWHFRYVGVPHASIIYEQDLCLEEYIAYLKNYPVDGEHLKYEAVDGTKYAIYYVKAASSGLSIGTGETVIDVPSEYPYEISGNNVDGFIVTVNLGK